MSEAVLIDEAQHLEAALRTVISTERRTVRRSLGAGILPGFLSGPARNPLVSLDFFSLIAVQFLYLD